MRRILVGCAAVLALAVAATAAAQEPTPPAPAAKKEDAWQKVVDLKSGTELRVFQSGQAKPIEAKMDEANGERLLIVAGNEQMAIPKSKIIRIDYRPPQPGSRVKVESKSKAVPPDTKGQSPARLGSNDPRGSYQSSSNLSFGGKAPFETIYRR